MNGLRCSAFQWQFHLLILISERPNCRKFHKNSSSCFFCSLVNPTCASPIVWGLSIGVCVKKSLPELSLYWFIPSLRFLHGSIMTPVPCGFHWIGLRRRRLGHWCRCPQFPHVPLPAWLLRSLSSWYSDIVQSAAARLLEALAGIDEALLYLLLSPVVPAIF